MFAVFKLCFGYVDSGLEACCDRWLGLSLVYLECGFSCLEIGLLIDFRFAVFMFMSVVCVSCVFLFVWLYTCVLVDSRC